MTSGPYWLGVAIVVAALGRSYPEFVLQVFLGMPMVLATLMVCLTPLKEHRGDKVGALLGALIGVGLLLHPWLGPRLLYGLIGFGFWLGALNLPEYYIWWTVLTRRRLVAWLGLKRLRSLIRAVVADRDQDAQGMQRRLLVWDFVDDEAIKAVEVVCPSTGQEYLLRVPPEMRGCAEAVAWTFEMGTADYRPLLET